MATRIFLRDDLGRRPVFGGAAKFQDDPHWRDNLLFYEYFHGDTARGSAQSSDGLDGAGGAVDRNLRPPRWSGVSRGRTQRSVFSAVGWLGHFESEIHALRRAPCAISLYSFESEIHVLESSPRAISL